MFPCIIIQSSAYGVLPDLPSIGICGHDLLWTEFDHLLKANGDNVRALLTDLWVEPGCKVLFGTADLAIEIEGTDPDLQVCRCTVFIYPKDSISKLI